MHHAHGLQPHRALLELCGLGIDALQHQVHPGAALAAQAAQFEHLFGNMAALVTQAARDLGFDLLRTVEHHAFQHLAALRQQLGAERGLQRRQPAVRQRVGIAVHARGKCFARRQREHAVDGNAQGACRLCALRVDLRLDLAGRGQRILQRIDLVQHDETGLALRAEMVTPYAQVRLGDAGVCPQDEDRRVRRGQQAQGQLGFGADRVQPRRVEHHEALAQQRVRVVDEHVAPQRHLDAAGVVDGRVVLGLFVVPETQLAGQLLGDPLGAGHGLQGLRQLLGLVDLQWQHGPGLRLGAQLGQRVAVTPGFDRQHLQRGRLRWLPGQFDWAHRGAPRRGRQHAPAGVGKKDCVDELRFTP